MKRSKTRVKEDGAMAPNASDPHAIAANAGSANKRRLRAVGVAAVAGLAVAAGGWMYLGQATFAGSTAGTTNTTPAAGFASQYPDQAKVQIFQEERDLGTMNVTEIRAAEFSLRNMGGMPLEISRVRTSCMCTFADIAIDGEPSPEFNMEMHNGPSALSWKGIVAPGGTATIRVIYKPSLMPVQGSVGRNLKFNTNDPDRRVVELGVRAIVQ